MKSSMNKDHPAWDEQGSPEPKPVPAHQPAQPGQPSQPAETNHCGCLSLVVKSLEFEVSLLCIAIEVTVGKYINRGITELSIVANAIER